MANETTFHASCHCKASKLSFTVPTSSLPLPTHFCHCSICRRTHGTLCTIHAPIPPPSVDLSTFTAYASSPKVARYFCSICGAHMLDREKGDDGDRWRVAASMADADEGVWDFREHIHLESTLDGGLATWLQEVGGKKLKTWKGKSGDGEEVAVTGEWQPASVAAKAEALKKDNLKAQCHCAGVEFYISRPRNDDAFKDMPANMTPKDKTKWYALNDVCTSCRLVSGCAIVSWAFPEISHITLADGSPYTPVFGTMKAYESSKGVSRTFCGTCGALVTYTCDERPWHVDVGVGLLSAESGARAEEWLEWRSHRLAYEEDCEWNGVLAGFKEGLSSWGKSESDGQE